MFDKFLCKRIHKKEITIGDIFNKYAKTVFWLIIISLSILGLIAFMSTVLNLSYFEITKLLVFEIVKVIGYCILITICSLVLTLGAIITFDICSRISKMRVATCPNVKPELVDKSQDQEESLNSEK